MVRAGTLRHRIILQTRSTSKNVLGERLNTWTEIDTVWAQVRPVSGQERLHSNIEIATTDYIIRIRYRTDITPAHRVELEDGTLLDIERVLNLNGRGRELELSCVERRPA